MAYRLATFQAKGSEVDGLGGEAERTKACRVIAHYNYTLRFRSCGPRAARPMEPRSGVTLSRHPPLRAFIPKNLDEEVTLSLDSPAKALPRHPVRYYISLLASNSSSKKTTMAETASDHIAPCNTQTSEAHNRRSAEYMAQINKDNIYVRRDLTPHNEVWVADEIAVIDKHDGKVLQTVYDNLAVLVKQMTGRKMQEKMREKVNPKTGKKVRVNGSSPIREGVVLMKDDTSMNDLLRYADAVHQRFGITPLQIFIHRDEGHFEDEGEAKIWKSNYHAHIVWDWINHGTGKSWKLNQADMRELQTIAAKTLQMERGKSKTETGKEHLERNDFIIEKQKREAELAEMRRKAAEVEAEKVEAEMKDAKQNIQSLGSQIIIKQNEMKLLDAELETKKRAKEKADKENANAILDKAASFFGKGELAEKKREVAAQKSENEALKVEIQKQKAEYSKELMSMRKHYEGLTAKEVEKNIAPYKVKLQEVRNLLESLRTQNNILANAKRNAEQKMEDNKRAYNLVVRLLGKLMCQISETFTAAIAGIINFAKAGLAYKHRDVFTASEAASIKQTMDDFSPLSSDRKLVGKILVDYAHREGNLTDLEADRCQMQVDDVASGRYDHIIERVIGQGLAR